MPGEGLPDAIAKDAHGADIELYRRESRVRRVSRGERALEVANGLDLGTAVRVREAGETAFRFGSSTGSDVPAARRCLEMARAAPAAAGADEDLPEGTWSDADDAPDLPDERELEAWLDRAWSLLAERAEPRSAWVEVARTVESWASTAGIRAVRVRLRTWAGARAGNAARPILAASRGAGSMSAAVWAQAWDARRLGAGAPGALGTMTFSADAAADLVAAIARSVAAPVRCGPGWSVRDDPHEAGAVLGATFDDAGFPTRSRVLGDGRTAYPHGPAAGILRRGSFRDRPAPHWFCIRVEPTEVVAAPPPGRWIESVRIQPAGDDWILELDGTVIRTSAAELVARCVGGCGPALDAPIGVRTPALVFGDLAVSR